MKRMAKLDLVKTKTENNNVEARPQGTQVDKTSQIVPE